MPVLSIELTETEYSLLARKANNCDLQQITRVALDQYFGSHRFTDENLPILDLSGHRKQVAALEADHIDPNRPQPPDRNERRFDNNRLRFETDEDFEAAMRAFRWRLDLYEAEKATFERKRSAGNINEWGGVSCTL